MVVNHLRGNGTVFAAVVCVGGAVSGGGVGKFAGEYQAGGFVLQNAGRFQYGGHRLVSAGGIYRIQVMVGFDGIGGYIAFLGGLSCNIAGGGGR